MDNMKTAKKVIKLSLACGQNKPEGFLGVDIAPGEGVDIVQDLFDFPWKFEDNSVDEIECSHFVEHIPHIIEGRGMKAGYDDVFYKFFDEVHRILKPAEFDPSNPNVPTKGFAKIVTPYYSSIRAWQDPTHMRAISEASYLYLNKKWREDNKLSHYPVQCNFDYFYGFAYNPTLNLKNDEYRNMAAQTQINAISDLAVTLIKR